jgi:hypothetical protein
MQYLNRLIRAGRSHATKRVNWLKFCRVCGADISDLPARVRVCGADCADVLENREPLDAREKWQRQDWRKRMRKLAEAKSISERRQA